MIEGYTWLCVRPAAVRQLGDGSRFTVRWLNSGEEQLATLVACTSRATLLRLADGAWLLLTYTAPAVAYLDETTARDAFNAVA